MITLLPVMQRACLCYYTIITYYYVIITPGSIITHYYLFQSPELADVVAHCTLELTNDGGIWCLVANGSDPVPSGSSTCVSSANALATRTLCPQWRFPCVQNECSSFRWIWSSGSMSVAAAGPRQTWRSRAQRCWYVIHVRIHRMISLRTHMKSLYFHGKSGTKNPPSLFPPNPLISSHPPYIFSRHVHHPLSCSPPSLTSCSPSNPHSIPSNFSRSFREGPPPVRHLVCEYKFAGSKKPTDAF